MWYEIEIQPDSNGTWLVTAPFFPEVTSFAESQPDEALVNGRNAIEEAIAARISDGDDIPVPLKEKPGRGLFVEVPALIFLKSALYVICKQDGISRAELVRRLGWHREQVDRLFRLDHKSHLDQMEAALKAIGVPLTFNIQMPEVNAA